MRIKEQNEKTRKGLAEKSKVAQNCLFQNQANC